MRNRISKIILAAAMAAAMLATSMTALAAGAASASVSPSSVTAKPGETVAFTVSVTNSDGKIGSLGGTATAEGLGTPTVTSNMDVASEGGRFSAMSMNGEDTANVKFSYTVPADAKDGDTYTFEAVLSEAGDPDSNPLELAVADVTATITVKAEQQPTPDDDKPTPGTPSDTTPSGPSNPSDTADKKPTNSGLDDVPKTGDASSNMMVYAIVAIAAAGAIAVVSAKKFAR